MSAQISSSRLKLLGSGHALPGEPVDNTQLLDALNRHCGSSTAVAGRRIARRLGIASRHLSRSLEVVECGTQEGASAPELCVSAVRQALQAASLDAQDMAYLLGHTTTPHSLLPPNIAWVAEGLSFTGPYLELRQACTGFANGLMIAAGMLGLKNSSPMAVVGSETGSVYFRIDADFLDREQLVNYVQMGDGAGAVVLGPDDGSPGRLISDIFFGQLDAPESPAFYLQGGGSASPHCVQGLPVFRHETTGVAKHGRELMSAGIEAVATRGWQIADFDWILPHQVNGKLARQFAAGFSVSPERVISYASELGNLGSAAIWVALDRFLRSGRIQNGERILVLGAEATRYMYGGFVYTH